ncbi:GGDEF domain-containing protein [Aestuariibacter salexigens]|uniref:GGDEF domain-containing protein n=1 Tax=Aestuariibacter salexigens TaxID=226010 RepID=UPI0004058655|nr:GGDEF domain-containing protein [Aestuariibacter salexigens]
MTDKQDRTYRRKGISFIINGALLSTLLLLVVVSVLAFQRLTEVRSILLQVANESVPTVISSGETYTHINALAYLSDSLSEARNEPALRLAMFRIRERIATIEELADSQSNTVTVERLEPIQREIDYLFELVRQRLNIEAGLDSAWQDLDEAYQRIQTQTLTEGATDTDAELTYRWRQQFGRVIALASQLRQQSRLTELRDLQQRINRSLAQMRDITGQTSTDIDFYFAAANTELANIITGTDGVIDLAAKRLRVSGRANGQGNFVRNLILDFANLNEFKAYQLSDSVLQNTRQTASQIEQHIIIISVSFVLLIFMFSAFVYFIHQRVVKRLERLNDMVQNRMQGEQELIVGDDEISDIAHTFDDFARTIERQKLELMRLSLSDDLTGISNRRALDAQLMQEFNLAIRHQWPLSMLVIDIDHFKQYNDHYGHGAGDVCIRKVANIINTQVQRSGDFVGRYGGEEFVCLLPDTPTSGALSVAQSMLESVAEAHIPHEYSPVRPFVTVSIGLSTITPTAKSDQDDLFEMADKALYEAKQQGRNRLVSLPIDSDTNNEKT